MLPFKRGSQRSADRDKNNKKCFKKRPLKEKPMKFQSQKHIRLWKLEAERELVSSWMNSGESFLRVIIVWKTRTVFQTHVYHTWIKCCTKASEKIIPKNTGWGRQKENKRILLSKSVCEELMYWETNQQSKYVVENKEVGCLEVPRPKKKGLCLHSNKDPQQWCHEGRFIYRIINPKYNKCQIKVY